MKTTRNSAFTHLAPRLYITLMLCLCMSVPLQAQKDKIDWKDDLITVNGAPYAKMVRKSTGLLTYDYAVSGFKGPELIYVKAVPGEWYYPTNSRQAVQQWYHEFNFIASGAKASIKYRPNGDFVAKLVAENKLIAGDALNADAERRFIQLFNGYMPGPAPSAQPASPAVVVNVNNAAPASEAGQGQAGTPAPIKSKSPVSLEGNNILREGVVIGKFRDEVNTSAYSQKMRQVAVYNDSGEKVAIATVPADQPQEWTIRIQSDGKEVNLLYDSPTELQALFKWLADKGYLAN